MGNIEKRLRQTHKTKKQNKHHTHKGTCVVTAHFIPTSCQSVNFTVLFACQADTKSTHLSWSRYSEGRREEEAQTIDNQCNSNTETAAEISAGEPPPPNLTFIFEEQRGAVFNHFIVLALEQLALAVVEEQRCDHVVQFHPGFIRWMLLQAGQKAKSGAKKRCCVYFIAEQ